MLSKEHLVSSKSDSQLSLAERSLTDSVLACCILHNFLCGLDNDDSLLEEFGRDLMQGDIDV